MMHRPTNYWPTITLALIVWVTIIFARTHAFQEMTFSRAFAIVGVAACWFTIGVCVERLRHWKD